MAQYEMTCTCGDNMNVEANSKEEAVHMFKDMMTEEKIAEHVQEKHPGEEAPTKEQSDSMIEQQVKEA